MFETLKTYSAQRNEKDYTVKFIIPGLKKEDIQLTIEDSILKLVTGEYKVKGVRLPDDIKLDKVTSEYKAGILTVVLPFSQPKKTVIKIS